MVNHLSHMNCTFQASHREVEETKKKFYLFLFFFILKSEIGMCNLETSENNSSLEKTEGFLFKVVSLHSDKKHYLFLFFTFNT